MMDAPTGLMHDKIIIIDSQILVYGFVEHVLQRYVPQQQQLAGNHGPTLIANYQAKFNELFIDKHFGTHADIGAQTRN